MSDAVTPSRAPVTIGTALPVLAGKPPVLRPDTVRGRRTFDELRHSKRRSRTGPVRVQFVSAQEADEARRIAFAVPRKVGTAVERNRCRRRLRAAVAEIVAFVPAGAYLVAIDQGVRELTFQKLRTAVIEAMQRAGKGEGG